MFLKNLKNIITKKKIKKRQKTIVKRSAKELICKSLIIFTKKLYKQSNIHCECYKFFTEGTISVIKSFCRTGINPIL